MAKRSPVDRLLALLRKRHDWMMRRFETMSGTPNEIDRQGGIADGFDEALDVVEQWAKDEETKRESRAKGKAGR